MSFLQGNTYLKPVQVFDDSGNIISANRVVKGEFVFGDLYKYYGEDGEVTWSAETSAFIVPFTEEDTFGLNKGIIDCQVRLVLDDGSVSGSKLEKRNVYETKSKTRLTDGGAGEQTGEILTIKLLESVVIDYNDLINRPSINGVVLEGNKTTEDLGLVSEESDPTVPQYVKAITQENIRDWSNKANKSDIPAKVSQLQNDARYLKSVPDEYVTEAELSSAVKDKASVGYVDKKVADLVNGAPETLDTLGEVASALQNNKSVVDALNSAIGNKANKSELKDYALKSELPTKTSQLINDSKFITLEDVPEQEVDLDNYYTKEEVDAKFGGAGENLLKVSPVITEEKVFESGQGGEVLIELKDVDNNYYCPEIEIGKKYMTEYKVNGIKYIKESVAIDFNLINPDIPDNYAFVLGVKLIDGQSGSDFYFDNGSFVIQGIYADNYSVVTVYGNYSENGYTIPSVELISVTDVESGAKYFTKEETKAYVQEQIDNLPDVDTTELENKVTSMNKLRMCFRYFNDENLSINNDGTAKFDITVKSAFSNLFTDNKGNQQEIFYTPGSSRIITDSIFNKLITDFINPIILETKTNTTQIGDINTALENILGV